LVTNPNIGLKPARQRGSRATGPILAGVRLPARAVLRAQGGRRRRRAQLRLPQPPQLGLQARMSFGAFGRVYLLVGGVVAAALLYLVQAAGATQASYEIGRLQAQQQDLQAEQDHLKYEQASLKSPAQIESEAAQANLVRPQPYRYVKYLDAGVSLDSPAPVAPDDSPLWQKALASIGRTATGSQDALAAGR
jgi:cell division protein FtsL